MDPRIHDEIELARIRIRQLSDAMAIDQNVEVVRSPPSLGVLWKLTAYPNTVDAPQGYGKDTIYFGEMIASSLWIPRGKSHKSQQQYPTALRCVGALPDVYRPIFGHWEINLPEKINKVALERYAASQPRWGTAALLRRSYKSLAEPCGKKTKRGRQNDADTNTSGEMARKSVNLD